MRERWRSSFLMIGGRDVGDRLDGVERVGALLIVAGVLLVVDEARAQHRQRGEDAVELEVVLRPRLAAARRPRRADRWPGRGRCAGSGWAAAARPAPPARRRCRASSRRRDRPACSRPPRPPRRRSSALHRDAPAARVVPAARLARPGPFGPGRRRAPPAPARWAGDPGGASRPRPPRPSRAQVRSGGLAPASAPAAAGGAPALLAGAPSP